MFSAGSSHPLLITMKALESPLHPPHPQSQSSGIMPWKWLLQDSLEAGPLNHPGIHREADGAQWTRQLIGQTPTGTPSRHSLPAPGWGVGKHLLPIILRTAGPSAVISLTISLSSSLASSQRLQLKLYLSLVRVFIKVIWEEVLG